MTAISLDEWLAGMIGYPVYRIDASHEACKAALAPHIAARPSRTMYYVKVDTRDIASVRDLCALGFYVVDVNVTLGIDSSTSARDSAPAPAGDVAVIDCDAAMAPAALAIAGSAIQYSRFHLDPDIPNEIAHRIKHDWIANYVRGVRGEALMVARAHDRVVGFLAVLHSSVPEGSIRTIDLVAVDSSYLRRGAGRAMVQAFIERYGGSSVRLQVGTQVANTPSLKLYQELGFAVRHSAYVMHLHTHKNSVTVA